MSEPEIYYNGVKVTAEEANKLWEDTAKMIELERDATVRAFNVSEETAAAIVYLRGRSRWTEAKEQELIDRDHAGNPIDPNTVLSGEF